MFRSTALILFVTCSLLISLIGCSDDSENTQIDGDLDSVEIESGDIDRDGIEEELSDSEEQDTLPAAGLPPRPDFAPSLLVKPEDKARLLDRITREPYSQILEQIQGYAARDHYDFPEPDTFDSNEQRNAQVAQAAAFLAWLLDDVDMAEKARDFMDKLSDNYASHTDFDIDIRITTTLVGYSNALDLLRGANMIPEDEAQAVEDKLTTITSAFYHDYVLDEINRIMSIHLTQNNHPIRTAVAIGYVAMAFPEYPEAEQWANWAFSELDYLWGPDGQYVAEDGGVCEGPLYFRFAYAPSLALFLAWENRIGESRTLLRDCINRQDEGHWAGYECTDGEPFVFQNPLYADRFQNTSDWFLALRMPDGRRPPMEDSNLMDQNGSGIMATLQNRPELLWDWYNNHMNMGGGMDLQVEHLLWVSEDMEPVFPTWTHRVMPTAGQAIFRSGWDEDARWAMLTAEHGAVRTDIHDHIDDGSFTFSAYGEYLLIDPGYYKPNKANNAVTAQTDAHNLLTIEGEEVPPKGLLLNFGGADAFLKNEVLYDDLAYVEAWQDIDVSRTERSMLMLHGRYLAVVDRIVTPVTEARKHRWRLHGYAGYSSGGTYNLTSSGATWERTQAGVDVYLSSTEPGLTFSEPPNVEDDAPRVHSFGNGVEYHGVMDGEITAISPGFLAIAAPYRVGATAGAEDGRLTVTALTVDSVASGVTAWLVTYAGGEDLLLLRQSDAPEQLTLSNGSAIETDAAFVFTTLSGDKSMSLMARGSFLKVNSSSVFENETGDVVTVGAE